MKDKEKKSKYYYKFDRNMDTTNHTWQEQIAKHKDGKINPKMFLSKEELGLKDNRVPEYYRGKNGYEARKVCDNFELPYHLATATTYILRSYKKHDTPTECLQKAINHLEFELEKIKNEEADF